MNEMTTTTPDVIDEPGKVNAEAIRRAESALHAVGKIGGELESIRMLVERGMVTDSILNHIEDTLAMLSPVEGGIREIHEAVSTIVTGTAVEQYNSRWTLWRETYTIEQRGRYRSERKYTGEFVPVRTSRDRSALRRDARQHYGGGYGGHAAVLPEGMEPTPENRSRYR